MNRMTVSVDSSPDEQVAASAREVVRALVKAVRAYKIYLPEHEIRRRFHQELAAQVQRHVDAYGDLRLDVNGYEFWCGSCAVYEEPNRFENLAFRCSADGVRQLTFHQGLAAPEIETVIDVFAGEIRPMDDDLVTRLWRGALEHVTYVVAETTAESGEDGSEPPLLSGPPVVASATGEGSGTRTPDESGVPIGGAIADDHTVLTLTEDEVAALQRDVAEDMAQDYVSQLVDILISIIALDDDEQSFLEVLQILDDIILTNIRRGQYRRAVDVLTRLGDLRRVDSGVSERSRALIGAFWSPWGTWDRVALLEDVLNQRGAWDSADVEAYLALLPSSATDALITLLERVQTAKGRRVLCETLVRRGAAELDTIRRRVPDAPWYLARNLIWVLGGIGDERALPTLEAVRTHPDGRLRHEALKAMELLGPGRADTWLPRWLNDSDETIRIAAMKASRRVPSPSIAQAVQAMIVHQTFGRRSEVEQREAFETLVALLDDAALPVLQAIVSTVTGWSWTWRTRQVPVARLAIGAARRLRSREAAAWLADVAERGPASVRDAARDGAEALLREGRSR